MAEKYIETVGRRKTAAARVRITPAGKQQITVNDKDYLEYFPIKELQNDVVAPFKDLEQKFVVTAVVKGGGVASQAEAVRLGIARGLIEYDAEH